MWTKSLDVVLWVCDVDPIGYVKNNFRFSARVHSHAHTIEGAKIRRIFEIYKYSEKISQNYSTAYGLLSTSGPIIRFIAEVMERRNFSNNQICNFFIRGPQRAMLEWGEQRPWSPADLSGAPRDAFDSSLEWGEEERWSALFRHAEIL